MYKYFICRGWGRRVRCAYPPYKEDAIPLRRVRYAYPPYERGYYSIKAGALTLTRPTKEDVIPLRRVR